MEPEKKTENILRRIAKIPGRFKSEPRISYCALEESGDLRRSSSLHMDPENGFEMTKWKSVSEKLDSDHSEKFSGHMLLRWFSSDATEAQSIDIKVATQFCTQLLAAGVLRQISDENTPILSTFNPDLMYYWTHSEVPQLMQETRSNDTSYSVAKEVELITLKDEAECLKEELEKSKKEIQSLTTIIRINNTTCCICGISPILPPVSPVPGPSGKMPALLPPPPPTDIMTMPFRPLTRVTVPITPQIIITEPAPGDSPNSSSDMSIPSPQPSLVPPRPLRTASAPPVPFVWLDMNTLYPPPPEQTPGAPYRLTRWPLRRPRLCQSEPARRPSPYPRITFTRSALSNLNRAVIRFQGATAVRLKNVFHIFCILVFVLQFPILALLVGTYTYRSHYMQEDSNNAPQLLPVSQS